MRKLTVTSPISLSEEFEDDVSSIVCAPSPPPCSVSTSESGIRRLWVMSLMMTVTHFLHTPRSCFCIIWGVNSECHRGGQKTDHNNTFVTFCVCLFFSIQNFPFVTISIVISQQDLHRHNADGGSWFDFRRPHVVANQKTCFLCMTLCLNSSYTTPCQHQFVSLNTVCQKIYNNWFKGCITRSF